MIQEIRSWFSNTRFYVLVIAVLISLIEYWYITSSTNSRGLAVHNLAQTYAFTSICFLYLALLAGPFAKMTRFSWRGKYVHARRALGVSAFYFAALHVRYAYFDILGGLSVILRLPPASLFAILLGLVTLIILFLMAITSFDKAVDKMTFPRWKRLHQFVYLAGLSIFFHASIMGSHFANKTGIIPLVYYAATMLLLGIHLYGFYKKRQMQKRSSINSR